MTPMDWQNQGRAFLICLYKNREKTEEDYASDQTWLRRTVLTNGAHDGSE